MHVFIMDLGFSRYIDEANDTKHHASTECYCPIKGIVKTIDGKNYSQKCKKFYSTNTLGDVWSLGVLLGELAKREYLFYSGQKSKTTVTVVKAILQLCGKPQESYYDK